MPAQVFDVRAAAQAVRDDVSAAAQRLAERAGITAGVATVMAGDDHASASYVRAIAGAAKRCGLAFRDVRIDPARGDSGLRDEIRRLNNDASVHGVIVMFPLPVPLTQAVVAETLAPPKDVDGITPTNLGKLVLGEPAFVPSTPLAGMELLRRHSIDVRGLDATVVGRSAIVGKPLALLLLREHATVTICHTRTRDLAAACRRADLLCAATGKAGLVTAEMVKPGAVVLDFGTSPGPDGSLVGDVAEEARDVAGWITPPGGTGPMTTAVLLRNTVVAAESALRS